MRSLRQWRVIFAAGSLGLGLGAAPVAPSYIQVQQTIDRTRNDWSRQGAAPQPNAPGWNAFFDALTGELQTYSKAAEENARLASLNRLYRMSLALRGINWPVAAEVREELRAWLRPRVRLAWARRRLVRSVEDLGPAAGPGVQGNRNRWVQFVKDDLGSALRNYDAAATVAQRQEALKRVTAALRALQSGNQSHPWVPSLELQAALDDLYNRPNLDVSADVASLSPALNANIVQSGPIYRKGYVSQVTAGPKTGFGLMPSDDGIAFYNSQLLTSVTPIWDFQQQVASDRKGQRAAKLYQFDATSQDTSELTVVGILRTTGLQLLPASQHNISAAIGSVPTPGGGFGRFIAGALGLNQTEITRKVFEGAIGQMKQNIVTESAELANERTAAEAAQKNAQLSRALVGNNTLVVRDFEITDLSLRSRPENALIGGTLQWRGAPGQVGADAPQPPSFTIPDPGVSADLHLGSILTSLSSGFFQSEPAQSVDNVMVQTRDVAPGAPPSQAVQVTRNVDYATYLRAVADARAAYNPKVTAIRVNRPSRAPEFAADARGFLVAVVHDLQIEVPAPEQAAKGGVAGPPAQVYRITAPDAEFAVSFAVTPQSSTSPMRLTGRVEGFDPGPGSQVFAVNDDEAKAAPLTAFTSTFVLGIIRARLQGQPIDVPLKPAQLRGFAINRVSPLDPSGWMRVVLTPTR